MYFVSYSWIREAPDDHVLQFVADLRKNGYDVTCDVMLMQEEASIHFSKMMAQALRQAEKVIIVLSEKYKEKADSFRGGVGKEYQYILEDITKKKRKYILVSFQQQLEKVTPDFLQGREVILLGKNREAGYNKLYHRLNETREYEFPPVNPRKTEPTFYKLRSENPPRQTGDKNAQKAQQYYETGFGFHFGVNGCSLSYPEAMTWYLKAADMGCVDAQGGIGMLYFLGQGVKRDYAEARKWFLQAAEGGCEDAMFSLGTMYEMGFGVDVNYKKAYEWYIKAAGGSAEAQFCLGDLFLEGRFGNTDYEQAFYWYQKAAEHGFADAQKRVALMYQNGYYVKKSDKDALEWLEKACTQGDAEAKKNLEKIKK